MKIFRLRWRGASMRYSMASMRWSRFEIAISERVSQIRNGSATLGQRAGGRCCRVISALLRKSLLVRFCCRQTSLAFFQPRVYSTCRSTGRQRASWLSGLRWSSWLSLAGAASTRLAHLAASFVKSACKRVIDAKLKQFGQRLLRHPELEPLKSDPDPGRAGGRLIPSNRSSPVASTIDGAVGGAYLSAR